MSNVKGIVKLTDSQFKGLYTTYGTSYARTIGGLTGIDEDKLYLVENTGVNLSTKLATSSLSSGTTSIALSQSVLDFDYIIITATSGATAFSDSYTTVMIPSCLYDLYASTSYRLLLKTTGARYANCYFTNNSNMSFYTSNAADITVYGVNL